MFKEWCAAQGFTNATNLSHVLMDGGVLSVPFDRLTNFYNKYIECISTGEKVFVVEQKTKIYNFFVDIDYKDKESLTLERVQSIVQIICEKVESLGGGSCLVSVSKPKPKGDQIKSGVHLNWPNFPVDQENAVYLRSHIVNTLSKIFKDENWENIIDNAVYGDLEKSTKGSGFRMPWSHKKVKGVVEFAYLPIFVYECDGPFKLLNRISSDPTIDKLFLATVRSDKTVSIKIEKPENAPQKKQEGYFTASQTKNEMNDLELVSLIENFVRKYLKGQSSAKVTKIFKQKNDYLVSTDSSYCENADKSHNSNHVWFYIRDDYKIRQKCFCTCNIVRNKGFCKDFIGTCHNLSPSIVNLLYPNKKSDKIKLALLPNVCFSNISATNFSNVYIPQTET